MTTLAQGDPELIHTDTAQQLLASRELARLAYTAADGTPRVFPMMFHWTGEEIVFATFAGARKIGALRRRPDVAITIDTAGQPPSVLLLRGRAEVVDLDGLVPEYRLAHERYSGAEQAAAVVAETAGAAMARIAIRPTWVGVLDFQSRFPGGGNLADRGRS